MKFVMLHDAYIDQSVWVNPENVVAVERENAGMVRLLVVGAGEPLIVVGIPEEIIEALKFADGLHRVTDRGKS